MLRDRSLPAWGVPLLFMAAALVYVWPLTLRPMGVAYPPGSSYTDLLVSHWPNAAYAQRVLWDDRQWPLWNAQLFAGQPFAADPLAGLWYPPAWLLLLPGLSLTLGFNCLLALHLAWGGAGLYRLLRAEGVSRGPALLGGLAFAGAPKVVAHLGAGHVSLVYAVSWTPWLLVGMRAAIERGGLRRGALAGASLALLFLADVRWAYYAGALAAAYGGWHWLVGALVGGPTERQTSTKQRLSAVLVMLLFAGLLSAVLAVPLIEFIQHSNRASLTLAEAAVYSLPLVNLLGVLLRNPGGFHEYMTYAGTVTALLAVAGIGRPTLFWIVASVLAAAFALGSHFLLFPLLFGLLPGLGWLRVPSRAWFIVGMGLCILAGHGAQALTNAWWPNLVQRYARLRIRLPSAATALFVMGAVGVFDLARFNGTLLEVRPMPAIAPAAAWLTQQPGHFRVYSPSYSLPAGDGLEHVDGVDPLQLAATVAFVERAAGVMGSGYSVTLPDFASGEVATANRSAVPDAAMLGLLNVRYIAAEFPLAAAGLKEVARFDATYVYENTAWRPRAWIGDEPAEVDSWSPNRLALTTTGPGRLVLSEVNYPGWRARIAGQRVPITAEHGLLRAVDVPAGTHVIEFEFRPLSVFAGAALTLAGVAALAAVLWRERRVPW